MTQTALPTPRFDIFYKHDELTRLLFDYAEAYPTLVAVRSIGKSHEGRDIWVATVTNIATGAADDKPAFWADGNIHAAELTASTAVLYYLHELLTKYGSDAEITQLLDTRAIYLCPRLNPDGAELALADRPRHIRSSTRPLPVRRGAGRRPDAPRTSTATAASSSCASPIRTAPTRSASRTRA